MKYNPAQQAMNIIRYIGDHVSKSGVPIMHFSVNDMFEEVGAPSGVFLSGLVRELRDHGVISTASTGEFLHVNLTLKGWERYESQKRGQVSGNQGFMAMQFGDPHLDPFARDVVRPAVESMGYRLFDMRDVARAGVIDNIMRSQIRDSAFLIADLTHDNAGAYWEAGYAEGLGKPVIYICERSKFEEKSSHFDTNHWTTILWSAEKPDMFKEKLIATLRLSLDAADNVSARASPPARA